MVKFVEIKTLCGGQRFELSHGGGYPLTTVRDVRKKLSDIDAKFQGCKIMYNVRSSLVVPFHLSYLFRTSVLSFFCCAGRGFEERQGP